ncbi:MAG: SurA N-terminal domain, partial [Bacteroidetes bacterium]|nr:SurA N-terminal domain [Bacteroidota bacterium]
MTSRSITLWFRAPALALLAPALLALLLPAASPAQETLDKIAAVVDNEVILLSELDAQVQFFVLNNRLDPNT